MLIERWRQHYNQFRPHSALISTGALAIAGCGPARILGIRPNPQGSAPGFFLPRRADGPSVTGN